MKCNVRNANKKINCVTTRRVPTFFSYNGTGINYEGLNFFPGQNECEFRKILKDFRRNHCMIFDIVSHK